MKHIKTFGQLNELHTDTYNSAKNISLARGDFKRAGRFKRHLTTNSFNDPNNPTLIYNIEDFVNILTDNDIPLGYFGLVDRHEDMVFYLMIIDNEIVSMTYMCGADMVSDHKPYKPLFLNSKNNKLEENEKRGKLINKLIRKHHGLSIDILSDVARYTTIVQWEPDDYNEEDYMTHYVIND